MDLALVVVAAISAIFTAVAAVAAWRAALTTQKEAEVRAEPYVAVGFMRKDYERDALIVPLKNLGLGPARLIALALKATDGSTISARISPGLAPMEREDWVMLTVGWRSLDLPDTLDVAISGVCEGANGRKFPLHFLGDEALPYPEHMLDAPDDEGTFEPLLEVKALARAVQDPDVDLAVKWFDFWNRRGVQPEDVEFVDQVQAEWKSLGADPDFFLRPEDISSG